MGLWGKKHICSKSPVLKELVGGSMIQGNKLLTFQVVAVRLVLRVSKVQLIMIDSAASSIK